MHLPTIHHYIWKDVNYFLFYPQKFANAFKNIAKNVVKFFLDIIVTKIILCYYIYGKLKHFETLWVQKIDMFKNKNQTELEFILQWSLRNIDFKP